MADFKVDAILSVFCQSIIFLGWGGGFQVTQWYLSLGQERSPWFLFVWRNLSGIMGVGCGIDILWSPGHCLPGQPQSWDWKMSGYGFPFLLKMLNLNRNLVHFFPGLKNCKVHGWITDKEGLIFGTIYDTVLHGVFSQMKDNWGEIIGLFGW